MRLLISELTISRIFQAIKRRFLELPYLLSWKFSNKAKSQKAHISQIKNLHLNKRCFIIANGPSLKNINLKPLKNEITFGMNRIYLNKDKMGYLPTYLVVSNELVINQFYTEIELLNCTTYLNWKSNKKIKDNENIHFFRNYLSLVDKFSLEGEKGFYSGGTVTYICLQLAVQMGFKEIYLIGLDHNFKDKGIPNSTEIRKQENDENHFHPNYFPKGIKWQLPDLVRSEIAYNVANQICNLKGIKLINLTPETKCDIFDKANYNDFLNKNNL